VLLRLRYGYRQIHLGLVKLVSMHLAGLLVAARSFGTAMLQINLSRVISGLHRKRFTWCSGTSAAAEDQEQQPSPQIMAFA